MKCKDLSLGRVVSFLDEMGTRQIINVVYWINKS